MQKVHTPGVTLDHSRDGEPLEEPLVRELKVGDLLIKTLRPGVSPPIIGEVVLVVDVRVPSAVLLAAGCQLEHAVLTSGGVKWDHLWRDTLDLVYDEVVRQPLEHP